MKKKKKTFYSKLHAKSYFKYLKNINFQNKQQATLSYFLLKKNITQKIPKFMWYRSCIQFYLRLILLIKALNNNLSYNFSLFPLKYYLLNKLFIYQWFTQKKKINFSSAYINNVLLGYKKFNFLIPKEKNKNLKINNFSYFSKNLKTHFLKKNMIAETQRKPVTIFNTRNNLSTLLKIMNKSFNNSVLWRKRNVLNLLLRPRILNILDKKITQNNVLSMQNNLYFSCFFYYFKKKKNTVYKQSKY